MAKRKRLTPANPEFMSETPVLETKLLSPLGNAPIAQVAGEAAKHSALDELSDVVGRSVQAGLMIQSLPLDRIVADHLVRDRISPANEAVDEDMQSLIASIQNRGQQTPIEVTYLDGSGDAARYGLISGWRRLAALRHLAGQDSKFSRVNALVRQPEAASDAYVAMVEENEIRVGLSYFERARIVDRAVAGGVYPTQKAALNSLFGSVSRAKRSKIGSFVSIVSALEERLKFPTHISERLGLRLAKGLDDKATVKRITQALGQGAATPAAEQALLETALSPATSKGGSVGKAKTAAPKPAPKTETPKDIAVSDVAGGISLTGTGVDAAFKARLAQWLKTQSQ
jgi:ParB family chromosome partitioning protein